MHRCFVKDLLFPVFVFFPVEYLGGILHQPRTGKHIASLEQAPFLMVVSLESLIICHENGSHFHKYALEVGDPESLNQQVY